jgi:hypothetical protein
LIPRACQAKAYVVVTFTRLVPVAIRRASVAGIVVPAAATIATVGAAFDIKTSFIVTKNDYKLNQIHHQTAYLAKM